MREEDGAIALEHAKLGQRHLKCEGSPELLFTENETNVQRLFGVSNASPYVKDGLNECVVNGVHDAVNPARVGTKAAARYVLSLEAGETQAVGLRLCPTSTDSAPSGPKFERIFAERIREADEFYATVIPSDLTPDARMVMRQALAGMLCPSSSIITS